MVTSVARATRPLEGGAPLRLGRLLAAVGGNAPADWRALFGYDLPEGVLIVGQYSSLLPRPLAPGAGETEMA